MRSKYLEIIDRVDDLMYEFYDETDSSFLKEKPEFRFLFLSELFSDLCQFNLANNNNSLKILLDSKSIKTESKKKSIEVCNIIKDLIGQPSYFAASYWSPVDRSRHTISHSKYIQNKNLFHEYRCNALLFYLLTRMAPLKFHSAINYISEHATRKDGLHSIYSETIPTTENHNWFHIPCNIHGKMMKVSGFQKAVDKLMNMNHSVIEKSLTIIMENLEYDKVMAELIKYQDIVDEILNHFDDFVIPDTLVINSAYFSK